MQISFKLGQTPLGEFNDTAQVAAPYKERLAAFGCRADGPPALHDSFLLMDVCSDALTSVLNELGVRSYRPWMLMIGPNLTLERRFQYPNYALSRQIRKWWDLLEGQEAEQDFQRDGKIRAAGIYQVHPEKFRDECKILTKNSWTLGIFSNRSDFLTMPGLASVYDAAGWNEDRSPSFKTNFLELGILLGPLGDVIVKTDGAFDDNYRSVNLVYDPSHPISAVFAAAHERSDTIMV